MLVNQPAVRDIVSRSGPPPLREPVGPARKKRSLVVVADGLVGAAVLALRNGGLPVDAKVFDAVDLSVARLR